LQQAGITVVSGILKDRAEALNESYAKYIMTGRPFVTLKIAMTLDGKIATPEGQSKWITGEKARLVVHRLRNRVDAIVTAIGTVKTDDPELTARIRGGRSPKRVVIDPRLEIPLHSRLLKVPPETIIAATKRANEAKKSTLISMGVSVLEFDGEIIDLDDLAARLGQMGITSLMIEGGSSLNSRALDSGIVDKVAFFIAPVLIGGRDSYPAVGGKTFRRLEEAYRLRDVEVRRLGPDILVEGYL
ncbi:MAG TPA: bifunctional diaminohydroxyphosphoribosylaminopyrimidine deaminase/5-amino-6-(5-phosphoribosylamino)uracil reductase RibD, partial [Dissulfurispiraceae bacterium]